MDAETDFGVLYLMLVAGVSLYVGLMLLVKWIEERNDAAEMDTAEQPTEE